MCSACGEKFYSEGLEYTLSSDKTYYIVTGIGTASGDIIIPDTHEGLPVKEIGDDAFDGCSNLTSIEIPAGVTSIGGSAFWNCSNLESVTFAEGSQLASIGSYAFGYCSSLTSIEIPAGVAELPDGGRNGTRYMGVFSGCSNLTDVSFAEGSQLTSIGNYDFYGCSSLQSIEIPAGVTSIGSSAFLGCSSLNTVYYAGSIEDWLNIEFGHSSSNPLCYGAELYIGGELVTEVVVPESITTIGTQLEGCTSLTSITVHSGVTSIEDSAFYGCSNLDTVYYSGSIENWFDIDFVNEYSNPLNNGAGLYIGGEPVTEVVVPESITTIGYQLTGFTSLTSITIHSGVTSIGNYAFYGCSNLTDVSFAEGSELTSIGDHAFFSCSSLTSLEIPAGVTSIGRDAFTGCSNLESVTFAAGSRLTTIGYSAFYGCSSLTSIEIPAGVTSIGSDAFRACSNLETIYYNGTEEQWNAIGKGSYWDLNCGNYEVVFLGDAGAEA